MTGPEDAVPGETYEEAVDRVFARVEADRAERLAQPITEAEIERATASMDRAERLQRIQESVQAGMIATYGRRPTAEESSAITRATVKGRLPDPGVLAGFEPIVQERIRLAAADHARRREDSP